MQKLREQVQQVAAHDAAVLLVGEPGTGREAFARYLHTLGPRASGPFVSVTCASLDAATAAVKLRGAPGVQGSYEEATGGSLFFGGVEDLSPGAQRFLLADLEQGGWQREGSQERQRFGFRLVSGATTGHDLPSSGLRRGLLAHP